MARLIEHVGSTSVPGLAAKRAAAIAWADDGVAYTDAKTDVVLTILDQAERWAADQRPAIT